MTSDDYTDEQEQGGDEEAGGTGVREGLLSSSSSSAQPSESEELADPKAKQGWKDKLKAKLSSSASKAKPAKDKASAAAARTQTRLTGKYGAEKAAGGDQTVSLLDAGMMSESPELRQAALSSAPSATQSAVPEVASAVHKGVKMSKARKDAAAGGVFGADQEASDAMGELTDVTTANAKATVATKGATSVINEALGAGASALGAPGALKPVQKLVSKGASAAKDAVLDKMLGDKGKDTEALGAAMGSDQGQRIPYAQHTDAARGGFHAQMAQAAPERAGQYAVDIAKGKKGPADARIQAAAELEERIAAEHEELPKDSSEES